MAKKIAPGTTIKGSGGKIIKIAGGGSPSSKSSSGGGDSGLDARIAQSLAESNAYARSAGLPTQTMDQARKQQQDAAKRISTAGYDMSQLAADKPYSISDLNLPTANMANFPTKNEDAFSGLFNGALATTNMKPYSAETTQDQSTARSILEQMTADKPESQADLLASMKKDAGIKKMESRVNDLRGQIEMEQARTQANLLKLRGVGSAEGVTETVYGGQQAQIDRESAIRLLPLTAQYNAELGRLESAEKNIQELFGAIVADKQAERQYKQNLYSFAYQIARDEQKDLIDAEREKTRKQERQEDLFLDQKKSMSDMAMKVGDYKLAGEILNVKSVSELNTKSSLIKSTVTKNRDTSWQDIDGQRVLVDNQTGEIINSMNKNSSNVDLSTKRGADKIEQLDSLINNSTGIGASSGIKNISINPFNFNKVNDWRADTINVLSRLTVDELGRVKADGVTFGALSDPERKAVGDAASSLNAGMIMEDGIPTGRFKLSEKKIKQELATIKKYAELDFKKRTGEEYSVYKARTSITGDELNEINKLMGVPNLQGDFNPANY